LRSPASLEGLTLGLAGTGGGGAAPQLPGLSRCNLACLRALFLAEMPCSSWFAVLEALQNADYVLTTRGAPPGRTPLSPGAGAGTPRRSSKRGGTRIEGQVEQQQQRHQAAAHPLLADVDSESVQAAIQRLFDASIMLEDSAFHDFVGVLCKLSSEWSACRVALMSVPVLALGRVSGCGVIIFQVRARVLRASSLPARNGLAGGGLVGSIFRGRWCVRLRSDSRMRYSRAIFSPPE
jgi:hypothetical protein